MVYIYKKLFLAKVIRIHKGQVYICSVLLDIILMVLLTLLCQMSVFAGEGKVV